MESGVNPPGRFPVPWRQPVVWLALGLGSGLSPKAPGTAGTVAALPLAWLLGQLAPLPALALAGLAFGLGIAFCQRAADAMGVHDHPSIVWDEFVGLWFTVWLLPAGWPWWLAAFGLFRLFDIWKPWPIRWLDGHVHGGLGIMLDDAVAALFAWVCLQSAAWWLGVSRLALPGSGA